MNSKKSQAAMEYMMIVGFILLILTPIIYLVYDYSNKYSMDIAVAQAHDIGQRLVDSSESIYYFGKPSRVTLELNMPSNIANMTIFSQDKSTGCSMCSELRFSFEDAGQTVIAIPSVVELRGDNSSYNHLTKITVFNRTAYSSGLRKIQLTAYDEFVEVKPVTG